MGEKQEIARCAAEGKHVSPQKPRAKKTAACKPFTGRKPAPDAIAFRVCPEKGVAAIRSSQELTDIVSVAIFSVPRPAIVLPERFEELNPEAKKSLEFLMSKLSPGEAPSRLAELPGAVLEFFARIVAELKVTAQVRHQFRGDAATEMFNEMDHLLGEQIGLGAGEARSLAYTREFEK
jgi:hypothetical protein